MCEADLVPLMQRQLDAHAAQLSPDGHCVAVLLCAGRFNGLRSPSPRLTLVRPFEAAASLARECGVGSVLLCVPTHAQRQYAIARWRSRLPVQTDVRTAVLPEDPTDEVMRQVVSEAPPGTMLILDFVGHPGEVARRLRELAPRSTVIDVGATGLATVRGLLLSQLV